MLLHTLALQIFFELILLSNGSALAAPITVAVIDSGVDIHHPLLRERIAINEREFYGQPGVDDDGNGYPDDVHGWNFAGSRDGQNLVESNLEITRLCALAQDCAAYEAELTAIREAGLTLNDLPETIRNRYRLDFDPSSVIGDRSEDISDAFYGNADVLGGDGVHGTHVAGIVAQRAPEARILPIRVLPRHGDERDKDVALAVRYAVDRGARIINMSFGKRHALHPEWVEQALRYAESRDVLIVHSAGNEALNTEIVRYFPRRPDGASNWLEVGASHSRTGETLIATFSNYGPRSVDLFAPGVGIVSAIPGSGMAARSGTSMAAAHVSATAARILASHPELSAAALRAEILTSVRRLAELESLSISGGVLEAAPL